MSEHPLHNQHSKLSQDCVRQRRSFLTGSRAARARRCPSGALPGGHGAPHPRPCSLSPSLPRCPPVLPGPCGPRLLSRPPRPHRPPQSPGPTWPRRRCRCGNRASPAGLGPAGRPGTGPEPRPLSTEHGE